MLNNEPLAPEAEVDVDRLLTRIAELEQDGGITVRRISRIGGGADVLQAEVARSSSRFDSTAIQKEGSINS
ncbi:MAG: hypothetical protein V2A61_06485 [Calditrichota bacterium]